MAHLGLGGLNDRAGRCVGSSLSRSGSRAAPADGSCGVEFAGPAPRPNTCLRREGDGHQGQVPNPSWHGWIVVGLNVVGPWPTLHKEQPLLTIPDGPLP